MLPPLAPAAPEPARSAAHCGGRAAAAEAAAAATPETTERGPGAVWTKDVTRRAEASELRAERWRREWCGGVDGVRDLAGDEWGDVTGEDDQRRARGKVRDRVWEGCARHVIGEKGEIGEIEETGEIGGAGETGETGEKGGTGGQERDVIAEACGSRCRGGARAPRASSKRRWCGAVQYPPVRHGTSGHCAAPLVRCPTREAAAAAYTCRPASPCRVHLPGASAGHLLPDRLPASLAVLLFRSRWVRGCTSPPCARRRHCPPGLYAAAASVSRVRESPQRVTRSPQRVTRSPQRLAPRPRRRPAGGDRQARPPGVRRRRPPPAP
jgi:hypothetical protein